MKMQRQPVDKENDMNMFCGRWALALLMSAACANATDLISPVTEGGVMPEWQPNTRCTLSASNPVVDYGIMSRWQLQDVARGSVSPGTRSLMLNVVCPHTRNHEITGFREKVVNREGCVTVDTGLPAYACWMYSWMEKLWNCEH